MEIHTVKADVTFKSCQGHYHPKSQEQENLRGNTLDQEMENLKASIPISFILCTSSCNIYQYFVRTVIIN